MAASIALIFMFYIGYCNVVCGNTEQCTDETDVSISFGETCSEGDGNCQEFIFDGKNLEDFERDIARYIENKILKPANGGNIPEDYTTSSESLSTDIEMTSEAPVNTTQASTVSESHQCFRVIYYFPNKNQITDFVKINKTMPTLTEATICAWVTPLPSSTVSGALFSYFTEHSYLGNTLLLFFPKNQNELQVHVNYRYAELAPSFLWTSRKRSHICVVVSTITDNVKMYVNGSIYGQQNFSFAKSNLPGNGTAIIGQEQDDNGGAFDKKQSFSGTVENFLMWNRILDDSEINKIHAAECDCVSNFILSPTRDLFEIHGNVNATYKDC